MGLPDAALSEADVKVLVGVPGVLSVLKVEADHVAVAGIGEASHLGLRSLEAEVEAGE